MLVIYNDKDLALKETEKFNNYLRLFRHFTDEDEPDDEEFFREDTDIAKDTIDSILKLDQ